MLRIDKRDGAKMISDQCNGILRPKSFHSNRVRHPIMNDLSELAFTVSLTSTPLCADVWMFSRQRFAPYHVALLTILDLGEQVRADSFISEHNKHGFVIARALLRILIAAYCSCDPKQVAFHYGSYGKPVLDMPSHRSRNFGFNMSHSADAVVIALVADAEIGVDIEELSSGGTHSEVIADACLNAEESLRIKDLPKSERPRTMLRYWAHKEACLKAIGCGLSMPPQNLTVKFVDTNRSVILRSDTRGRPTLVGYDLPCGEDYIGAIVGGNLSRQLRFFRL